MEYAQELYKNDKDYEEGTPNLDGRSVLEDEEDNSPI